MMHDLVVIGGGAAGCFAAIRLAEFYPGAKILVLEAARQPLSKVEISGGGRCNVTHACFDPQELISYYPRGREYLLGPFNQFQPKDLIEWFKQRGIRLKTEGDGRMFPVTDNSATIINCFQYEIKQKDIQLLTSTRGESWSFDNEKNQWDIKLFDGRLIQSHYLLISSGSDQRIWNGLKDKGHNIVSPVPSLFTFNIKDKNLNELMGISRVHVHVSIPSFNLKASGPLLITHWGVSGPAILKMSAWGARDLYRCGYVFDLRINWTGDEDPASIVLYLKEVIGQNQKRQISNLTIKDFPSRLWKYLCVRAGIPEFMSGAEFGKKQMKAMLDVLTNDLYRVTGKSTFKEEFVTAGGIDLEEVDMNKFESKKQPGLFLVGELLNIDALTGGFNFQAAWTGAHIVAQSVAKLLAKVRDK